MNTLFSEILLKVYNYSILPKKTDNEYNKEDNKMKSLNNEEIIRICDELVNKIVESLVGMPMSVRSLIKLVEIQAKNRVSVVFDVDY